MLISRILMLTITVIAVMPAAELDVSDLRLGGGILSKTFTGGSSYTVTSSNGTATSSSSSNPTSVDAHRNYRGELQLMFGHLGVAGGFLAGADVAVNQARFTIPGAQAVYTTPVVDVDLGYGIAPLPNWHFELTALGGFGWTYYRITGTNQTSTKVNEHYLEYGARLATYYAFGNKWMLGVEVPYLVGAFHPRVHTTDSNGSTIDASDRERNRGFGILAQIGVRL